MSLTVTVTGNLKTISANVIRSGVVTAKLVNFGGSGVPYVPLEAIIPKTSASVDSDADGNFSITLYGNDVIIPDQTYYEFFYQSAHSSELIGPECYVLHSATGTVVPITPPPDDPLPSYPYDVAVFWPGKLAPNGIVTRIPFTRMVTFPAGLSTSKGTSVWAAAADSVFSIRANDAEFATATFHPNATITFSCPAKTTIVPGGTFSIIAPPVADGMLSDVGLMIAGTRSV